MIAEKEKAVPAAKERDTRKMIKCPQKTGINLNMRENQRSSRITLLVGCAVILLLAAAVAKFGVIDQYRRLDRAEAAYNQVNTQYQQAQEQLKNYDRVLMEYRTYSMDWMTGAQGSDGSDLSAIVDRQKVLDLLEQQMLSRGRLNSLQVAGDTMVVSMSGMNLEQISDMFAAIQQSPIVGNVELKLASTEDGNVSAILDFTMRITLQQEASK